jgi:hypothetical protein
VVASRRSNQLPKLILGVKFTDWLESSLPPGNLQPASAATIPKVERAIANYRFRELHSTDQALSYRRNLLKD